MADLLSIGRFARLTGLSIGALRHYDEVGLLRPARTDPDSGYRLYREDQLRRRGRSSGCARSISRSTRSAMCSPTATSRR
jgi:DNA-binding transcriptional MerR regulator